MPELGKATYELIFNTSQVAKMTQAEAVVVDTTDSMASATAEADATFARLGAQTGVMARDLEASLGAAAEASNAFAAATERAAARAGMAVKTATAESEGAIARFGKIGGGMGQMLGLGAAYFFVKGGLDWMKSAQQGWLGIKNAIQATGGVAGVTAQDASKLSDQITNLTGNTRGANLQMEQMLLRFDNLRNMGTSKTNIFDRAGMMVENIATVTQRSTRMIALALGKTLQDPANNLNSLGRAGIRFNKTQQDMVKNIQAGTQSFQGYTGVLGAQLYVLQQLHRYNGAAAAQEGSLTVQWNKAKDAIDKSAASILKGFLPTLISLGRNLASVAGLLAHHTTLLKDLIEAYVLAKGAAFAFNTAMKLGNLLTTITSLGKLKTALFGVRAAETATAGEAGAMDAAMLANPVGAILIGLAALGAGFYELYKHVKAVRDMANATWDTLKHGAKIVTGGGMKNPLNWLPGLGKYIGNETYNAVNGKDNTPSSAGTGLSPKFIAQLRARYQAWIAGGVPTKDAIQSLMNMYPGLTETDVSVITGAKHAEMHKGARKKPKPPHTPSNNLLTNTSGNFLSPQLQLAEAKAGFTKSTKDDIAVWKQEETYLFNLLKTKKLSMATKTALWTQLDSIQANIENAQKALAKKLGKYTGLVPLPMAEAYQKALQDNNLKKQIAVLKQEETYLQKLVNAHKLHGAKQLAAMKELTKVKKDLAAAIKKEANAQDATKNELQAFMDTRGSFFSEFASSVFHAGPNGMETGSASTAAITKNISQTNHFNEMPKDRFALGREMARAAAAV